MLTVMLTGYLVAVHAQWAFTPEMGMTAVKRSMGSPLSTWRPGVKVGMGVEYQFQPGFFALKSGLYYTQRGYEVEGFTLSGYTQQSPGGFRTHGQITDHYLQLPVMADFSFALSDDCRLHLAVGPYVALSIAERWEWGAMGYGEHGQSYPPSPFAGKRAFDWGASASVGLEVKRFVVSAGYDLSLGKEYPKMKMRANYHTLSLTVGYKFKVGR